MNQHNVSVEDYKKLKQLDRIEYLLRAKHMDDNKPEYGFSSWIGGMGHFILDWIIILLLLGIFYLLSKAPAVLNILFFLMQITKPVLMIYVGLMLVGFLIWMIQYMHWKKQRRELISDFFEIKPSRDANPKFNKTKKLR